MNFWLPRRLHGHIWPTSNQWGHRLPQDKMWQEIHQIRAFHALIFSYCTVWACLVFSSPPSSELGKLSEQNGWCEQYSRPKGTNLSTLAGWIILKHAPRNFSSSARHLGLSSRAHACGRARSCGKEALVFFPSPTWQYAAASFSWLQGFFFYSGVSTNRARSLIFKSRSTINVLSLYTSPFLLYKLIHNYGKARTHLRANFYDIANERRRRTLAREQIVRPIRSCERRFLTSVKGLSWSHHFSARFASFEWKLSWFPEDGRISIRKSSIPQRRTMWRDYKTRVRRRRQKGVKLLRRRWVAARAVNDSCSLKYLFWGHSPPGR